MSVFVCGSYHIKTLLASEELQHESLFHQISKAMRPLLRRKVGASAGLVDRDGLGEAGRDGDDEDL